MRRLSLKLLLSLPRNVYADEVKAVLTYLEESQARFGSIAMDIWDYAEL